MVGVESSVKHLLKVKLKVNNFSSLFYNLCSFSTEGDFYHCHGTMHGHGAYSDTWEVAAFNRCENVTSLSLWYNITFEQGDEPE